MSVSVVSFAEFKYIFKFLCVMNKIMDLVQNMDFVHIFIKQTGRLLNSYLFRVNSYILIRLIYLFGDGTS